MIAQEAINAIRGMEKYAELNYLGLILVGSVGYRCAYSNPENFELCDDLDCIFVYHHIDQLAECPYISGQYYSEMKKQLEKKSVDMISTKTKIGGIHISADFISLDYMRNLANEVIDGTNKYRFKLTDAVEIDEHVYSDFWGDTVVYKKSFLVLEENLRIYKLPIHYFCNNRFYGGVLFNKLIHHPFLQNSIEDMSEIHRLLLKNLHDYFLMVKKEDSNISILNNSIKRMDFHADSLEFMKHIENPSEEFI